MCQCSGALCASGVTSLCNVTDDLDTHWLTWLTPCLCSSQTQSKILNHLRFVSAPAAAYFAFWKSTWDCCWWRLPCSVRYCAESPTPVWRREAGAQDATNIATYHRYLTTSHMLLLLILFIINYYYTYYYYYITINYIIIIIIIIIIIVL